MTREEKTQVIDELVDKFGKYGYLYFTDATGLSVAQINKFRRLCFDRGISYGVYKNTLIKKALGKLEQDYEEFSNKVLKGFTGIIFSEESGNLPAKVIKEFRKGASVDRPLLKGASIDTDLFVGENQLDVLVSLKTKNELIADVILLLQSPAKNVISALQSGTQKLAGIVKTLSDREQ